MRPEAFILRQTKHGRRLLPITVLQAEELVSKSEAKSLGSGFYDGITAAVAGSPEQVTRKLVTTSKAGGSRSGRRPPLDE